MKNRALCLLRESVAYRRDQFCRGLQAAGYMLVAALPTPTVDDVVVIWNRSGASNDRAKVFERIGACVVVAENGHFGRSWRGGSWYALACGHHAGAGTWPYGGPERWSSWDVDLAPWREGGEDIVILDQRGIGEPGVASPRGWAEGVRRRLSERHIRVRVRTHPGNGAPRLQLADDLQSARAVVTWHSAAAASALLLGVPVFYDCPSWIGRHAGLPLAALLKGAEPKHDDADRLAMFRRMAWAMWHLDEIGSGAAFRHLLQREAVAA